MDPDTQAALAAIQQGIADLAAGIALVARHQTIQGEQLARIVGLLTPDEGEKTGPTTQELLERLLAENEAATATLARHLHAIGQAVRDVPLETVRAIDDNLGPLARAPT